MADTAHMWPKAVGHSPGGAYFSDWAGEIKQRRENQTPVYEMVVSCLSVNVTIVKIRHRDRVTAESDSDACDQLTEVHKTCKGLKRQRS